jgi:hypothetical protein
MSIGCDWLGESVRLCVNLCLLLDNNICLPLDNNICLLLDNNIGLRWDYVFCWILPHVDIFYLIEVLGSSIFNFHLVNRMLINCELSIGVFLHLTLLYLYLWYYTLHIITFCTCWVSTISVLNLTISFCCTNLLLRSWMRFWILWWGVLGEWLLSVDCLWSYGVFLLQCFRECST